MSTLEQILQWPWYAVMEKSYAGGAAGLAAMYYWLGGLPFQGQDTMQLAQAYLLGGGAFYLVAGIPPDSSQNKSMGVKY